MVKWSSLAKLIVALGDDPANPMQCVAEAPAGG
jgi:hypothetical protein